MSSTSRRGRVYQLPASIAADLSPPKGLSEAERAVWRQWMPVLAAAGVVDPSDLMAFTEYCKTTARRDAIEAKMGGDWWATTADGNAKGHPGAAILAACERRIDRLAGRLGLDTLGRLAAAARKKSLDAQGELPIPAPVPRQPALGKKEQAQLAAVAAGKDDHWGEDLAFSGSTH